MRNVLVAVLALILTWTLGVPCLSANDGKSNSEPKEPALPVKLGRVPAIKFEARPPLSDAKVKQIKGLIADLAKLDSPDFGLSATMSGDAFAPLPGQSRATTLLFTDHKLKQSETLKTLVALGPDSLPFLLDALDDQTPTKLVMKHQGAFGAMWHAAEVPMNPVNPAEAIAYKAWAARTVGGTNDAKLPAAKTAGGVGQRDLEKNSDAYTLKVGDVCFVAIGQIVGRSYQAVRYQPTACTVLNCPANDPTLCAEVREIWKSKDPVKKLFDSLLADYATEDKSDGQSPNSIGVGDNLRSTAALRLLYYFQAESASLVAGQLDKFDVTADPDWEHHSRRCAANGLRSEDYIRAVSWCQDKEVQAALLRLFKRAEHGPSLEAALPAISDRNLIRKRLEPLVANLPADERGPSGSGESLLMALAERTPDTAKPVFQAYLKNGEARRCYTVCRVLREVIVDFDIELLAPLLGDDRYTGWAIGEPKPDTKIRVCDGAASALYNNHPEFKFVEHANRDERDKQIAVIRETLKKKK
jgi:hypothetical protein